MTIDPTVSKPDQPKSDTSEVRLTHLHFGTGRLGLGLVAPCFQKPGSSLYLLNRAVSGSKDTGATALSSERRNVLLQDNPDRCYVIQKPGGAEADRHVVHYDGFFAYGDDDIEDIVHGILTEALKGQGSLAVVVTASVLRTRNYGPIVRALNAIATMAAADHRIGTVILVACENTISAHDVFRDEDLAALLSPAAHDRVIRVHALSDRMCVGLEEDTTGQHPTVLVRAEDYGSLKLEMTEATEHLVPLLSGSGVEFSRHVDTEKQIKNWLLNGTHSLIALRAYQDSDGDHDLKLNQYLESRPEHAQFAREVMDEMRDGVSALLRKDVRFESFVRDVDVDDYLNGAAAAILKRFSATDDPITRILARFQAPTSDAVDSVASFSKRLVDRVDAPMRAFEEEHGSVPAAATHSVQSLLRLLASGTFIDSHAA